MTITELKLGFATPEKFQVLRNSVSIWSLYFSKWKSTSCPNVISRYITLFVPSGTTTGGSGSIFQLKGLPRNQNNHKSLKLKYRLTSNKSKTHRSKWVPKKNSKISIKNKESRPNNNNKNSRQGAQRGVKTSNQSSHRDKMSQSLPELTRLAKKLR